MSRQLAALYQIIVKDFDGVVKEKNMWTRAEAPEILLRCLSYKYAQRVTMFKAYSNDDLELVMEGVRLLPDDAFRMTVYRGW